MRVNPGVSQNIQGTQTEGLKKSDATAKPDRAKQAEEAAKSRGLPSNPGAEISDKAKDLAKAYAVASATPDVREDRIAELKKRISSGDYKIDSDKVADKMISEHAL
jgi:negative regulator of flagellin synthesis FlgM